MTISITQSPIKSPSLGEYGPAILVDENANRVPVLAVLPADSSGHLGTSGMVLDKGEHSQVTAREMPPMVESGGKKIPVMALVGLNSAGVPVPYVPASAAKVTGKFASTVQTGTGSSQNVAHGLAVVPSLVLVSIYDTNGVALPIAIVEGAHDATNVKVTVTASVKFKVIAFA